MGGKFTRRWAATGDLPAGRHRHRLLRAPRRRPGQARREEIAIATTYYSEEGGYEGTRELLNRSPRPTAIFAGADQAAFGALAAIHEAGLSVPGDISIAGFDNTRLAALPNISLTSVDQDGVVMGRTAGRLLLERIEGRTSAVRFSVTPTLIHRSSTGPPGD